MDTRGKYIIEPSPPISTKPDHWSTQDWFWDSVNDMTCMCEEKPWYDGIMLYTATIRPLVFETALEHAIRFIKNMVQSRNTFYKVGITGHVDNRWDGEEKHAYKFDPHGFTKMRLLWCTTTSLKKLPESSGKFEWLLGKIFHRNVDPNCLNREHSGGECPGRGSPQFCYVVW